MDATRSFHSSTHFADLYFDDVKDTSIYFEDPPEFLVSFEPIFDDFTASKTDKLGLEILKSTDDQKVDDQNTSSSFTLVSSSRENQLIFQDLISDDVKFKSTKGKLSINIDSLLSQKKNNINIKRKRFNQIKQSPWSKEAEDKLIRLVKTYGASWKKIGSKMRLDPILCRFKWESLTKKDTSLTSYSTPHLWTGVEENKLIKLVKTHGTSSWVTIGSEMNLSAKKCKNKWNRLLIKDPELAEENKLIKLIKKT